MASISVEKIDETTFRVTVGAATSTTHTVTVSEAYRRKLVGDGPAERLVEKSFEFLLEREPNTSILRTFDLPLIQQYFSEYERTISGSS